MAKSKGSRTGINLKCTVCSNREIKNKPFSSSNQINLDSLTTRRRNKKSVYRSSKNRQNTSERLELRKFCRICNSHSIYKESK